MAPMIVSVKAVQSRNLFPIIKQNLLKTINENSSLVFTKYNILCIKNLTFKIDLRFKKKGV